MEKKFRRSVNIIRIGLRAVLSVAILCMFVGLVEVSVRAESLINGNWEYDVYGDEVTIIKYMGSDAVVVIPYKINGKKVTKLRGEAFSYCDSVKNVIIPESVTDISYAFYRCKNLRSVNIPSGVYEIDDHAFEDCNSLESIEIPNGVTYISWCAFKNCSSLKCISIPRGVTGIGDHTFMGCISLKTIELPVSLKRIGSFVFDGCPLKYVYYEGNEEEYKNISSYNSLPDKPIYNSTMGIHKTTTICGKLNSVDTTLFQATIDGVTYDLDDNFPINEAIELYSSSISKYVICKLDAGLVSKLLKIEDEIDMYATMDETDFIYENGGFINSEREISIDLGIKLNGKSYREFENKLSDYKMDFSNIRFYVNDEEADFGKGIFGSSINEKKENNTSIGFNSPKSYKYTLYINKNFKPEEKKKSSSFYINAHFTVNGVEYARAVQVNVLNNDYNKKVTTTSANYNKLKKKFKAIADDNSQILLREDGLGNILSGEQNQAVREYLILWITEVSSSEKLVDGMDNLTDYVKNQMSDKLRGKLGINKKFMLFGTPSTAITRVRLNTKYGEKTIKFILKDLSFGVGDSSSFGSFSTIEYEIENPKDVPTVYTEGVIGMSVTTDLNQFCDDMIAAAEETIKYAYGETIGNHIDEVVELVIGKNAANLLEDRFGTLSDNLYKVSVEPSLSDAKKKNKKVSVKCPVDIYVYNNDNELCGLVIDNSVDDNYGDLYIYVVGDKKVIVLPDDEDYRLKFVGTDTGTMQYTIEEMYGNEVSRTIRFDDVPLIVNKTYTGNIIEGFNLYNGLYSLTNTENNKIIMPNYDSYVEDTDTEPITFVSGVSLNIVSKKIKIGENFQLDATVSPDNSTYKEVEWSSSNKKIVTVDDNGLVKGVSTGKADITVITKEGQYDAVCKIEVVDSNSDKNNNGGIDKKSTSENNKKQTITTSTKKIKVSIPKKGSKHLLSSGTYKVTASSSKKKEVTFIKPKNKKVTNVKIPKTVKIKGYTYKVTTINKNAFKGCKKLKKVVIGKNVKIIGSKAFYGCKKHTKVTIGANVTTIGASAFEKCTSLKSIAIPKKVKKIGKKAFYGCKKLKTINIKTTKLKAKTVGAKAFGNIYKKPKVKVPKNSKKAYKKWLKKKGLTKKAKIS